MPVWESSYSELPFLNWILQKLEGGKKEFSTTLLNKSKLFNPYKSLIFPRANKWCYVYVYMCVCVCVYTCMQITSKSWIWCCYFV